MPETERSAKTNPASLIGALDSAKRGIAIELHDDIAQRLALVRLLVDKSLELTAEKARPHLVETLSLVSGLFRDVLELSRRLDPAMHNSHGLEAPLERLIGCHNVRTGSNISLKCSGVPALSPEMCFAAYSVIQQLLQVVTTTSAEVAVTLRSNGNALQVRIRTRERASPKKAITGYPSIVEARSRARAMGGRLKIQSRHPETSISVELPLAGREGKEAT